MSNPYFNNTFDENNPESELFRMAADELCEMNGIDFKYIMKSSVNPDFIFGEDNLTKFDENRTVTLYIENYENFDGVDDMFSKFGFQVDNKLILNVERVRVDTILGRKPEVGDLLLHLPSKKIFDIKHVDDDHDFYMLNGGRFLYRLTCEIFAPSYEDFESGVDDVDLLDAVDKSDNDSESDQFDDEELIDINFDETDVFGNL